MIKQANVNFWNLATGWRAKKQLFYAVEHLDTEPRVD